MPRKFTLLQQIDLSIFFSDLFFKLFLFIHRRDKIQDNLFIAYFILKSFTFVGNLITDLFNGRVGVGVSKEKEFNFISF